MGQTITSRAAVQSASQDELIAIFARLMRERHKATLYLFGSRARGTAREHSDYDIVAVSDAFGQQSHFRRCLDRDELWHTAGGWRKALDLHCYTPGEFRKEVAGLGYLGQARARGELIRIKPAPRAQQAQGRSIAQAERRGAA
ncbi:MAG: nucleotidyltransferase domain-containing protein [Chloroflexi bacterium]|nr:nucleotidyltransferase domain-containing protein [Chloroflexota bacterium]